MDGYEYSMRCIPISSLHYRPFPPLVSMLRHQGLNDETLSVQQFSKVDAGNCVRTLYFGNKNVRSK